MGRLLPLLLALALCALGACAGTSHTTTSAKTTQKFSNVLVIVIAGDYETRAQFERALVSQIRQIGSAASTYHSVVGGNSPVTREDVIATIEQHDFDAVLAVRRIDSNIDMEINRSRTEIDATPIGGRFVNLFRSDYTDYTMPESIDLAASAALAVELYDAASTEIVYEFDHQTRKETNFGLLIDQTAATIVRRLDREKLLSG
jgi:hypothetical protein